MSEIIIGIKSVRNKAGRPMIIVQTDVRDHWVTTKQWEGHGNSMNLEAYKGGEFSGDYFAAGDTLISGNTVEADGIILRDFVASQNPEVTARAEAAMIQAQAKELRAASALFARNRKAPAPVVVAETEAEYAGEPNLEA